MAEDRTLILTETQVQQKVLRMAYEIYENNFKEKQIVIAGIEGQGLILAESLKKKIK